MTDVSTMILAIASLVGMSLAAVAGLKGWQAWLDFKRLELASHLGDATMPPAGGRIEIADLKERVRKLEAIAAGIDL